MILESCQDIRNKNQINHLQKKVNNLPTSEVKDGAVLSKRNNSGNHEAYEILFSPKEDTADQNIEDNCPDKDFEKPIFGSVSTLDWLKTWRSLEIDYASSPEPGR